MKKVFFFCGILALALSSCLGDSENNVEYYQDTGLVSFTLGSMKQTFHTKSSTGEDSTYTKNVDGSTYAFTIDQQLGLVYNVDSLPVNTNVARVLCMITTKNLGTPIFSLRTKDGLRDSLVGYSSTDSVDFTKPRELRVYNQPASSYRTYVIEVRVHQQSGNEFQWQKIATGKTSDFAGMQRLRMVSVNGKTFVLGLSADGTRTKMFDIADCIANTGEAREFGPTAIDNVVVRGSELLLLDGTTLWHTAKNSEGTWSWTDGNCNTTDLDRLVGASSTEIYARSKSGWLLVSTDGGQTWKEENLDSSAELLPTENISCTVHTLRTNDDVERVMLVGTRPDKDYAVVWMKIIDEDTPANEQWMLVADGSKTTFALPKSQSLCVAAYGEKEIALGAGNGALAPILLSSDGGLSWQRDDAHIWSTEAVCTGSFAATVDEDNFVWVVMGGSGQVWRGRLNSMGWKNKR